jgi:organic hydroperoxide reductase OsmC/OhrA
MCGFQPREYIYKTALKSTGKNQGVLSSASKENTTTIEIALPEELGGPKGFWSPDELFVSSVEACAMLTFFWLIESKNIEIVSYQSEAEGISKIASDREFRFTQIVLKPVIVISNNDDLPEVENAVKKLENWCCVSNSTKAEVIIEPEIKVIDEA